MHSLTTAKFPSPIVLPTLYRSVIVAGIWKPSSDSSERISGVFLLIGKGPPMLYTLLSIISWAGINSEVIVGSPPPLQAHTDSMVFTKANDKLKKAYQAHLERYHCSLCFLLQWGFRGGKPTFQTSCSFHQRLH